MHTYQHLRPGMGAAGTSRFADLIDASRLTSTVAPVARDRRRPT